MAGRCASPARPARPGSAGVAVGWRPSPAEPAVANPTSATVASVRRSPPAGAVGAAKRVSSWPPGTRSVSPARPERPPPARTATTCDHPLAAGRKDRCASPATAPPCPGGGNASSAVKPAGWSPRLVPTPASARTAPTWNRSARCATCGIEDRLYHHGRCVRCALAERAAAPAGGTTPRTRRRL